MKYYQYLKSICLSPTSQSSLISDVANYLISNIRVPVLNIMLIVI